MKRLACYILLSALGALAASAYAGEPSRFDARETLQRAKVGTYSPRVAAPLKVEVKTSPRRKSSTQFAERLECRPDHTRPEITVCEYRKTK